MGAFSSKASSSPSSSEPLPTAATHTTATATTNTTKQEKSEQPDTKISKNQLKRQRKWEEKMEVKRRRKEQERNIRIANAKAQGRDIEMERQQMEENRKNGAGWARRNVRWQQEFERKASKYQICVDCSFEKEMTESEINSLAMQIRYCYAANKRAKHPVSVKATSLNGSTLEKLENVSGFDSWKHRAFDSTEESVENAYPDKSKLVYLTSDSDNVLESLEDDKIYIIGGIVDRNRLKRAAINRAEHLGIATAKLPISNYLEMSKTNVLTTNHVFEIMLKYREHDEDWKKSFLDVLPERKDAKGKND